MVSMPYSSDCLADSRSLSVGLCSCRCHAGGDPRHAHPGQAACVLNQRMLAALRCRHGERALSIARGPRRGCCLIVVSWGCARVPLPCNSADASMRVLLPFGPLMRPCLCLFLDHMAAGASLVRRGAGGERAVRSGRGRSARRRQPRSAQSGAASMPSSPSGACRMVCLRG